MKKVAIIGLGNLLLRDEGFGIHLIRRLEKKDLPPDIELIDGGCAGMNLLHFWREREAVFLLDVFLDEAPAGTIRTFTWEELENLPPTKAVSGHQYGVKEALSLARLTGQKPSYFLAIAAIPAVLEPGLELSPPLKEALPRAEKILFEELSRLGYEVS